MVETKTEKNIFPPFPTLSRGKVIHKVKRKSVIYFSSVRNYVFNESA